MKMVFCPKRDFVPVVEFHELIISAAFTSVIGPKTEVADLNAEIA